jgi:hypothetical protein
MEGFYSGNLADAYMKMKRKAQVSNMGGPSQAELAGMTRGWADSLGSNNRADIALAEAKKNAADQLGLQRDTLAFNKENAAAQLAAQKEMANQRYGLDQWSLTNQLEAARKAQPSNLDKVLQYGGTAMNALALNNLAGDPLKKLGETAGGWLFDLFGGSANWG